MAFDKGLPIAGRKARYIDDDIRANNDALETAIDNEHDFTTGGTQTGRHAQGSARCFFQDAAPSTRIDGTAFTSADFGSLWFDSNSSPDNQFNVLTAVGPVTWTPVSTEIIAVLVAKLNTWALAQTFSVSPVFTLGLVANNSYIQGRNQAGNGNIDIVKVNTSDGVTLGAVATLPDTSALATSAAPAADAQLANKKYVDDQITASLRAYIKLSDVKAQNTPGGTFTSGAWRTRTLNTEDSDTGGHCALAANQITLAAGTYECRISAPAYCVFSHQLRLYNVTGAALILRGATSNCGTAAQGLITHALLVGRFTIAAAQAIEVQHICNTTRADDGFGEQGNLDSEVYTVAEFWKI